MTYDEIIAELAIEKVNHLCNKMRLVKMAWQVATLAGSGDAASLEQEFLTLRDKLEVAEVDMHALIRPKSGDQT